MPGTDQLGPDQFFGIAVKRYRVGQIGRANRLVARGVGTVACGAVFLIDYRTRCSQSAVMVLTVVVAQVVDIQFNWVAETRTESLDDATRFFGNFFTIMGMSAFLFQLICTSRIHRGLGVGVAMRILPVAMAVGSAAVLFSYHLLPVALLGTALALKVGENGIRYSLDQATRELLFLPVPSNWDFGFQPMSANACSRRYLSQVIPT